MRSCRAMLALAGIVVIVPAIDAAACSLRVGWENYPPFQVKAGDQVGGLDVELFRTVAGNVGCTIVYSEMPWKELLTNLEAGKMDAAMGITRTADREAALVYSLSYRTEETVLFMRKGEAARFPIAAATDLGELTMKIGVVDGYDYGEQFARAKADPIVLARLDESAGSDANLKKLLGNRIDAFLEVRDVGRELSRLAGAEDRVEAHPFVFGSNLVRFAFSRASVSPEFVARFDEELKRLKAVGMIQAILAKYR